MGLLPAHRLTLTANLDCSHHTNVLCKDGIEHGAGSAQESKLHSQGPDVSVWGNRCITSAQLGIQILNHPGLSLHVVWSPPTYDIPKLGTHACARQM